MSYIKLTDINLNYQLLNNNSIKDLLMPKKYKDPLLTKKKSIHALKNINLSLTDGDRLAIIGHNGAGKSSFLKLVSGIFPPASGELLVEGRIASLFELATGFEMEATGWENIKLRGLMLGESPKELSKKMQEIAEFSGLGDHLNIPVKYYSSGMFVRLAFSISTSIEPDILLLDEVVASGDARFLIKAQNRLNELVDRVKILIYVTHSMSSAFEFCNKCIWLENGEIKMTGTPQEVTDAYMLHSNSILSKEIL